MHRTTELHINRQPKPKSSSAHRIFPMKASFRGNNNSKRSSQSSNKINNHHRSMTGMRSSIRRLSFASSTRGISLRRSSLEASSAPSSSDDANQSAHHSNRQPAVVQPKSRKNSTRLLGRKSSLLSSVSSNADDHDEGECIIDLATQELAIQAAEDKKDSFRESLPRSLIAAHDTRDCVAPFQREEIVFGPLLGSGEFSNVYEIKSLKYVNGPGEFANTQGTSFTTTEGGEDDGANTNSNGYSMTVEEMDKRLHMKKYEKYRETKNARYALKHIKESYFRQNRGEAYVQAASDLALEAEFLASLVHPNIIKLRGISYNGAAGFEQGPGGYFLIIDRLFETLDQRMRRWRRPKPKGRRMNKLMRSMTSFSTSASDSANPSPKVDDKEMDERFNVAFQIAAGIKYLHTHRIIFRDLKPANIGFDVRGDVKIFDFGLARIMPDSGDPNTDTFDMSGAGSPRYMAPECLLGEAYNMKADVYSFSMIVWEILAGQTPFAFVRRRQQLIHQVVYDGVRPDIVETWPSSVQGMLESSFDRDIGKRPKMDLWYNIIREVLANVRGGDRTGLSDTWIARRRSFESMRNLMKDLGESLSALEDSAKVKKLKDFSDSITSHSMRRKELDGSLNPLDDSFHRRKNLLGSTSPGDSQSSSRRRNDNMSASGLFIED